MKHEDCVLRGRALADAGDFWKSKDWPAPPDYYDLSQWWFRNQIHLGVFDECSLGCREEHIVSNNGTPVCRHTNEVCPAMRLSKLVSLYSQLNNRSGKRECGNIATAEKT